jgi:CheY-like chemotaxis protein
MSRENSEMFGQMLLKMRNSFLEDIPEKLDRLDQLLFSMEEGGVDTDSYNEFYRIIHSLKGGGGTFGLHIITTICHQLEDLLNTTDGGAKYSPVLMAVSLKYIVLLRNTIVLIHSGSTTFPQIEESLSQLRNQLAHKQFTVLVVDDSKLLTQMYLQALKELPVRAVVVTDGYIALLRALTEPFDLLITTNELPVLNGIALIGALKLSDVKNHPVKTILITSNKSMTVHRNQLTDPDYIIIKDAKLTQNLIDVCRRALSIS